MTNDVYLFLSCLSIIHIIYTRREHYLIGFCDSSTATLNAPNKAVNWIFSLPPNDNRCLPLILCSSHLISVTCGETWLTRIDLNDPVDRSDSDSVTLQSEGNHMLPLSYLVMPVLVQSWGMLSLPSAEFPRRHRRDRWGHESSTAKRISKGERKGIENMG
jgi:hypothetical protein